MKPEFHKLVVLSTAHLTAETNAVLGDSKDTLDRMEDMTSSWGCVYVCPADAGYFFTLSHSIHEDDDAPQCVKDVCAYARKHGCNVIRIDRDGPTMSELPTYNW